MKSHRQQQLSDPLEKLFKDKGILPDVMTDALAIVAKTGILYHSHSNKYFLPRQGGGYSTVPWSGCMAAIRASGVVLADLDEDVIKNLSAAVIKQHAFDNCLNLAGYPAGLAEMPDGSNILVQRGMAMIEPVPGDSTPMLKFLDGLLNGNEVAKNTLLSWLHVAVTDGLRCAHLGALKANIRPSQVLIIVGPPACGKTLLTTLIGEILGNTRADPYPFMSGLTAFNGDLAQAVLLVMDDVTESVMPKARHSLSQHLKQHTVNPHMQVHAKYCQPFTAQVFQRVMMLANEDSLNVLPAMSPDFIDKVILMQAFRSEDVDAYRDLDQRAAWLSRFRDTLPAFVHYLLYEFIIPEELRDGRYGVKAYHAPNLMAELRNDDHYVQLLEDLLCKYVVMGVAVPAGRLLIPESNIPGKDCYFWIGSAKDFHQIVYDLPESRGWRSEFSSSHAAGMALKNMANSMKSTVVPHGLSRGIKRWKINFGDGKLTGLPENPTDIKALKLMTHMEKRRQSPQLSEDD